MLYVVYRAPETANRVSSPFSSCALMFAMLRLSGIKLAVLGFVSLTVVRIG
jgi:hypothetical protein